MAAGLWVYATNLSFALADSQSDQLKVLNNAMASYETTYYTNLVNHLSVTGVANPYSPTVAELISLGLLQPNFSPVNLYQGGYQAQISLLPSGCTGSSCNVFGLTYITSPIVDSRGQEDDAALGEAIQHGGGDTAGSTMTNPTQFVAANAIWSAANPLGSKSGILAMRSGYGTAGFDQFLRRDGTLPMTGNLNMGAQSIGNTTNITATGAMQSGTMSTGTASVSGSTTTGSLSAGTTSLGATTVTGNTSMNGNASVTGSLSVNGSVGAGLDVNAGRNVAATQNITAGGAVTATGGVTGDALVPSKVVVDGSACTGYVSGAIAKDVNGALEVCQAGLWTSITGGGSGGASPSGTLCGGRVWIYSIGWQPSVPCKGYDIPNCPPGYTLGEPGYNLMGATHSAYFYSCIAN